MIKQFFKACAVSTAFLLSTLAFSSAANATTIKTDIVMIVDESGSMGGVQANLRNNIGLFASILSAGGLDARYALVGYGRSGDLIRLITDFVDAADFALAAANLVASGGTEPAYDATAYALNSLAAENGNLTYRNDAVKNMILYTDEASNGDSEYTAATLDTLLKTNNSLFNAVVSTESFVDFVNLANNNGGQFFDLDNLNTNDQNVVQTFVTEFAEAKLQETFDFCDLNPTDPACVNVDPNPVPAPAGLLFFLAAIGVAGWRQKAGDKLQLA